MLAKFDTLARRRWFGIGLSISALLLYNNWLLGPYLNRELFDRNGSVSEFSAITQPHFWVFRSLDIVSGLLLVLLGLSMSRLLTKRSPPRDFLIVGTIVLGLANIMDASFALRCSETLSASCNIPVSLSLHHLILPSHAYSSVIIAICYLLLPIAGLVYAITRKMNLFMLVSAVAAAVALESLLSVIIQYFNQGGPSVRASGDSQEFQMLVLAAWFVGWSWSVYAKKHSPALRRQKPVEA